MRRRIVYLGGLFVLLLATTLATAAQKTFTAHLSGQEVVPSVETNAQGQFILRVSPDGTIADARLNVSNIENVMAASINLAGAGSTGPVVLQLYSGPTLPGKFSGQLSAVAVTGGSLTGPLAGQSIEDLIVEIQAGRAYVCVQTMENPDCEIRGQL